MVFETQPGPFFPRSVADAVSQRCSGNIDDIRLGMDARSETCSGNIDDIRLGMDARSETCSCNIDGANLGLGSSQRNHGSVSHPAGQQLSQLH